MHTLDCSAALSPIYNTLRIAESQRIEAEQQAQLSIASYRASQLTMRKIFNPAFRGLGAQLRTPLGRPRSVGPRNTPDASAAGSRELTRSEAPYDRSIGTFDPANACRLMSRCERPRPSSQYISPLDQSPGSAARRPFSLDRLKSDSRGFPTERNGWRQRWRWPA
jgi:hypothetical protein